MPSILSMRSLITVRPRDERAILLVFKVGGWGLGVYEITFARSRSLQKRLSDLLQDLDSTLERFVDRRY